MSLRSPIKKRSYSFITEMIDEKILSNPTAIAITEFENNFTYESLDRFINLYAHTFLKKKINKADVIAIIGDSSFLQIAAIIGCWKMGAVILTIDPTLPLSRILQMLDDAKAKLIVSNGEKNLIERILQKTTIPFLNLQKTRIISQNKLEITLKPEDPAYIFFTSGSTGKPKGILGAHKGLSHFIDWQRKEFKISNQDRCAQLTSVAFDVVLRAIFTPLCSGASVVIPPSRELAATNILPWMKEKKVTMVHLVPSLAKLWLSKNSEYALPDLRWVFFAGEKLHSSLLVKWHAVIKSSTKFINLYGPTETTLAKCFYRVKGDEPHGILPVGKPLPETQIFILDSKEKPNKIGEIGEIVIKTPYISLGYLHNEPRSGFKEGFFFTGDLGFINKKNELEILGRKDHQVKYNGVRIEVEEIEITLNSYKEIEACAVAIKKHRGSEYLVAFLKAKNSVNVDDIRSYLRTKLPETLIPNLYVKLIKLPYTKSGKLDRKKLPELSDKVRILRANKISPEISSETERLLLEIWTDILNLNNIGLNENFFTIGGNSLQAMRIIARVAEKFGINIPQTTLMQHPTIVEQARDIDRQLDSRNFPLKKTDIKYSVKKYFPLSINQQEYWYFYINNSKSPVYNVYKIFEIKRNLDPLALEHSLQAMIKKHQLLSARFSERKDGGIQQAFLFPVNNVLEYINCPSKDIKIKIQEIISTPFDLLNEYPFRFYLFTDDSAYYLVLNIHHIVTDGWSSSLILKTINEYYEKFLQKKSLTLSEQSPGNYQHYVASQKKWLASKDSRVVLNYWENELRDCQATGLLADFTVKKAFEYQGNALSKLITRKTIDKFCREAQITPYTFFYTALNIFLARYTQTNVITLGSPVANRANPLTEHLVGPLVNTLVFRLSIDLNVDFITHLKLSYQKIIDNIKHQEMPFSVIYSHLLKNKIIQQNERLFSIFFYTENFSENDLILPGSIISDKDFHNYTSKFDLSFCIITHPDTYQIKIEFDTSLYKDETINMLLRVFSNYLFKLIKNPKLPIKEHALYDAISSKSLSYLKGKPVDLKISLLNAIFKKCSRSDHIVIQDHRKKISYKQLFSEVDRLASYLLKDKNFSSSQRIIAICMDRSSYSVIAMLAVLKSGEIYVPINMQAPSDRIKKILKKTAPDLIITTTEYEKMIKSSAKNYINIETFKNKSKLLLKSIDLTKKLAYLVFTSGTTGEPKGILQTHNTLTNLIHWQVTQIPGKHHNVALFSSFGFDVSIQEVLYSLYTQSTLYVIPEELKKDAQALWSYLIEYSINILFAPPQILYMLCCIDDWKNTDLSPLKYIIVAGEALKIAENEKRFFSKFKNTQLINQYGPSESHVVSSYKMPSDPVSWPESPPIGSPIFNTDIVITDTEGNILPKNAVGELCIAGMNLAEGYYHAPVQTNEKFIRKSYCHSKYTKIYKTGDLAKVNSENQLVYLGRTDRQIKILGYRVELIDIEINLSDHPNIKMCAVKFKNVSGKNTLIAYIVPKKIDYDFEQYQLFLDERLPDYMVPKRYVHLKKMPMTENGKIDVSALAMPKLKAIYKQKPITKLEKQIAKLWQTLLNLSPDDIDINANFFNVGGTSLLAVKMLVNLEKIIKIRLKIRTIYENPSIKALASYLQKSQFEKFNLLPLFKAPIQDVYALTDQQSFWWVLDKISKSSTGNIQFTITIHQSVTTQDLKKCLKILAHENAILRLSIDEIDGYPMQRIHQSAFPSIKVINLSKEKPKNKNKKIFSISEQDNKKYFDLKKAPLYRVILFKYNKKKTILYFCFHHIIFDEWSMNLFSQRVIQLLVMLKENKKLVTKKQAFNYEDYVYTQHEWKSKSLLESSEKFWDEVLASATRDAHILYDKHVSFKFGSIERIHFNCSDEKILSYYTEKMATENITTFVAMLTVYRLAIFFFVSQANPLIGVPFLNRNRTEFTEILGLLTNTVPINISINPDNCFIEICQQVNSLINQVRENINYTFNPENLLENFNFMFIYKNAEVNSVVDAFYGKGEKTQFDLVLICIKKLDSVSFILEYNSDLFHKNSIRNFAEVFKNLLLQISKNQLKSINQYKINSKSREKLIINQFCHGSKFSHAYKNAFEIFEKVAVRNPKLIALQFYEIAFTYEEVLTKCNLIANQLYPKHKIVGIFLNRSNDVVMAILAVLRAGAAYVPLDPNYPQQQLKYMYDQSGMDCILTNTSTLASSNTDFLAKRTKIINMDHIKICKNLLILPQACLNNLAYIIYTSGSTGKPKGVMVTHGNLVNTILACNKYLNIPKNSRFSQFFSINFDASILDIFLCFHYESTLYIIDEMTRKQPDSLILFFKKNKINIANLTPAILSLFAKTLLPNLHTLILGGDVPEQSAINYWLQNRNLYNAYGPTETTIVATIHRYRNHDDIENIGKPLPNFSCYILNENLQLLPTGVIGELYIGGKSLARGYVGRDDLTEERFISIPHIDSKTKLYKTGDRVYWNNAGDIIFMGRNDSQVKFRGYRIELGNIESCLSQLNYINQSVVILIEQNGVRHLIAYYTLKDKVKTNFDIKKDLRRLLPEYMIPTQYMCLDYFPITANGKIDKRTLPPLSIQSDIKKISPRTTLEKDIATTWANVLGIPNESIGINDSFYDLGGQSLSLAKMISELSAKHAIQVDYASFMSNPTIEFIIEQLSTNIDIIGIERKDIKQAIEDTQVFFPKNKFLKAANFQTPKHILLTGATGFVGTYLLQELLHSTEATIHCLIRDPSKINNTSPRVISYISDLTKPYLGLKKDEYESLSGSIDAIYHCAAYVNHILGYTVLRSANVLATKTLIDLVTRGKPKAFHYISTISCATIEDERGQILEAWPSRTPTSLTGGYALSKWAAECLVKKAKEANYHCSIYRLGNVTGDSATGYSRIEVNHVYLFLKGCLQMGYAPEMNDFVEMTPVDILSKAIFSLSTNPKSKGEVYQLNNPSLISWDNLFRSFAPVASNIKLIPFSKWQKEHLSNIDESNAFYPLKALYMGKFENKLKKYDTKKTQNLLKRLGIEYPKDYTQLLKLYTTFSNKIKFF